MLPAGVETGQVRRSCDPRGGPTTEIITTGGTRADVADAYDGKRARSILPTALHASPTTKHGRPRRAGYILEPR
ncbi:hypothetical protein ABZ502_34170 [Streptomyces abikoensis]|uniref:hypothetical protein n=1 Tax=Streptomyces abikoensis TaxID=97398 RepID=UPI00340A3851